MLDIRDLPVLYINLDHNVDRKSFMESHLTDIGCNKIQRIPAVWTPMRGYDGNIISHIKAAYNAFSNNTDEYVLVLEDDGMITDVNSINETINRIIQHNPHINVINIQPNFHCQTDMVFSPPEPATDLHCCILYRRENIMTTMYRYLLSWLVTGVIDRIGTNDVNYAVAYTNAYKRLGNYFISNCTQTLTRIYIKRGPYNHTYGELKGNVSDIMNHIIMRFYYTDADSLYEVTPFSTSPIKIEELYSNDTNQLVANIYTHVRNLGAKRITINDGSLGIAFDLSEFITPQQQK